MPLVLAYHGCDLVTAQELLGGSPFLPSERDYDWLGAGSYFWENDILRAHLWAKESRREFAHPSVVGAVIELGNCLDLTTQAGIEAVKLAHDLFVETAKRSGAPLPSNVNPRGSAGGDRVLRRLDCAVMNYLYAIQGSEPGSSPYTTVRALFPEGGELYPGSGFLAKTHIQICVREPEQILGIFRVPAWQLRELELDCLYTPS